MELKGFSYEHLKLKLILMAKATRNHRLRNKYVDLITRLELQTLEVANLKTYRTKN